MAERSHWGSRLGFILAAAGSAIGLGNIWKFPYITGENGGGLFVLIYLACIAIVGLPILIAEFMLGRSTQSSPIKAFSDTSNQNPAWIAAGTLVVLASALLLSFYSVVAGWACHYIYLGLSNSFSGDAEQVKGLFGHVFNSAPINIGWHAAFMLLVMGVVLRGVQGGIERASKIMMPLLFLLLLILTVNAALSEGFGEATSFLFSPNADKLTPAGVLEALGHAFFTLSVGFGTLLTYASYMNRDENLVGASVTISVLDTVVALLACLILFPILFSSGEGPAAGPGLVFQAMPVAIMDLPGGAILAVIFFVLLFFAAFSSAISLLEPGVATIMDTFNWSRGKAIAVLGTAVFVWGIPSAVSGADSLGLGDSVFGKNFFDAMDWLVSNALLPINGLIIAVYVGWFLPTKVTKEEFNSGHKATWAYGPWLLLIRFVAPIAILLVLFHSLGLI